jgi:hypothetical protein
MINKSVCEMCHKTFMLSKNDICLVEKAKANGQKFIMVECTECLLGTSYVPPGEKHLAPVNQDTDMPYRCPVSHCIGWVVNVDSDDNGRSFFGCGECGSIWYDKNTLYSEIAQIVKKYPYRKKSYYKKFDKWIPADPEKESQKYEEKVKTEPFDEKGNFERG